ncbi:MAG: L-threonylcarbamoyladenylate synthase [Dissulfurimicrobium sp.]|uniref:L-threonylcarbamoyladenylate synthase n=1 Tax=Dissulfurimicrobium sp. TaxID=2022436 RepID=UPI004049F7A3
MNYVPCFKDLIMRAISTLKNGGVIAYPTETSYGLGASIEALGALDRIYEIKKRPADKPLLVIIKDTSWLKWLVADIPDYSLPLMERFWPGPLTILFSARPGLPFQLCASTGKIGVRISSHPIATALLDGLDGPITATSANLTGFSSLNSAQEVIAQLVSPPPDFILDGGPAPGGPPSTIVDVTANPPVIVRHGAICQEDIQALYVKGRV